MKNILILILSIQLISCTNAQDKRDKQHLAVCNQDKGCEFSEIVLSASQVDRLLGKKNFWTSASANATLILDKCKSNKDEKRTLEEIDRSYGGNGENIVLKEIDLEKYIKDNGCITTDCPNETKKISFEIKSKGLSGNGYYYLNLKAGEAYMPNASFQAIIKDDGVGQVVIDQFVRDGKLENYVITEGRKYHVVYPVDASISTAIKNDAIDAERFKNDFKETGNTRPSQQTNLIETEFTGTDNEGAPLNVWLVPSIDVCLPPGKFSAHGFYNLGYISIEGKTYLITEMSADGFMIKVIGVAEDTYHFNPTGYETMNMPAFNFKP